MLYEVITENFLEKHYGEPDLLATTARGIDVSQMRVARLGQQQRGEEMQQRD